MIKTFEIEIPDDMEHICYNYGCVFWYSCLRDNEPDDNTQSCIDFREEKNKSYKAANYGC